MPLIMDKKEEIKHYIEHVKKEMGIDANSKLAHMAGVTPSTLNRFMSGKHHDYLLSNSTISKIEDVSGIPFSRGYKPSESAAKRYILSEHKQGAAQEDPKDGLFDAILKEIKAQKIKGNHDEIAFEIYKELVDVEMASVQERNALVKGRIMGLKSV